MMTDEERAELRAMLVDVIGAACNSLQEQLGEQIGALQEELAQLGDRLMVNENDVGSARRELARLMREQAGERRSAAALAARVAELDRRTAAKP